MKYGPPFTVPDDELENTPEGWKLDESEFFFVSSYKFTLDFK